MKLKNLLQEADKSADADDLVALLAGWMERSQLEEGLQEILSDARALETAASKSYVHPNGFRKIVIGQEDAWGSCLRIHTWLTEALTQRHPDIHNHSWNFASLVANGSLSATEYASVPSGHVFVHRLFGAGADSEHPVGTTRLDAVRQTVSSAGDIYGWTNTQLHGPESAAPGTVTVLLQGRHIRTTSDVFSPRDVALPTSPPTPLTPAQVASDIAQAAIHIANLRSRASSV